VLLAQRSELRGTSQGGALSPTAAGPNDRGECQLNTPVGRIMPSAAVPIRELPGVGGKVKRFNSSTVSRDRYSAGPYRLQKCPPSITDSKLQEG